MRSTSSAASAAIARTSNTMSLDEAIRRIGLKMEVRKRDPWSAGMVMWAEIGEIQTLLDWIADRRAPETKPSRDAEHCDYPDCEQHWRHVVETMGVAGDNLAHQSIYTSFHERWWQARGGHDKCTVCVPGNPHTAEWFCLCGEPLPDPRADCPKCTPLKASTETLLQQPVAWRCKNGFGDWRYTSVSPVSSPYSPAYEPLYVRAESKASEQAGHHCGMLKAECKDEFCPTHGQDIR